MKKVKINQYIITLILCLQSVISYSQNILITQNTTFSILTVDVANEAHTLYGHTGLRISDNTTGIDVVYNYGMFDFDTENFILKFIKGDLQYYAGVNSYYDFEYSYKIDNRTIYEQVLDITLSEKQAIFEKLNESLKEENKYYTYRFIDENCTTKIINILNKSLNNTTITQQNSTKKTYRDVLYPYLGNHFYEKLGINIIFGTKVDQEENTIFLPLDLMQSLQKTTHYNKPLVSKTQTLFKASNNTYFSYLDSIYSLIIVLLFFVLLNNKITNIIYFILLGITGLLFLIVSFYSLHKEVLSNYNMLLFNPLFLFLAYYLATNNKRWIKRLSIASIITIIIFIIFIINKIYLSIILPFILSTLILLVKQLKTKKG